MLEISSITTSQVRPESSGSTSVRNSDPQAQPVVQARVEASPLTPMRVNEAPASQPLTEEELRLIRQLRSRDREVRAHEAAHKGAAGRYAKGGASFEYERGPDGRQYAVGGEVRIDISKPEDPQEALEKAEVIRRAALAPTKPSHQDLAVAAQASEIAAEARAELQTQEQGPSSEAQAESDTNRNSDPYAADAYVDNATNAPKLDVFA